MYLKSLERKVSKAELKACWAFHNGTKKDLQDAEQELESAEYELKFIARAIYELEPKKSMVA
jgi:hypothetical protein